MKYFRQIGIFILFIAATLTAPNSSKAEDHWKQIGDGLFLGNFEVQNRLDGDFLKITILKIDPAKYGFRLLCASEQDNQSRNITEWAKNFGLIAVINAGMYHKDGITSAGYMKNHEHVNNPHVNHYRAFLAFNPIVSDLPPIQIIDRECQNFDQLKSEYQSLFQGIRMISCKGENVWRQQADQWSTASVGIDEGGNALFIFGETPSSVHDFIDALLSLPISIHNAMYLEGGAPASFYLAKDGVEIELHGRGGLDLAASIPNVLGVVEK